MRDAYDYVIIGGGTAGCVLASRISEDGGARVLLIEAGTNGRNWRIDMPAAYDYLFKNARYNWCYQGEPEPTLLNRRLYQPRGKVLGGSSSINGLGFIRGHPLDYDRWAAVGARGWSYAEVLPYFKRSESWIGGEDQYRGGNGPIRVISNPCQEPLYQAFLEAGKQAGYPLSPDLNGALPEGFGAFQTNIDNGVRASTARAYLKAARTRRNLKILTNCLVCRIVFDGKRAVGVEFLSPGGCARVRAESEVLLAAGAFNSPQILMLSGVGPEQDLKRLGIPVVHHSPSVGRNLQDHPIVYLTYECRRPVSLLRYFKPHQALRVGLQWFATKTGPAASNNLEAVALVRSDPSLPQPDIEIQKMAILFDHDNGIDKSVHGFTFCIGPTTIDGTGWLKLRSSDPRDTPRILCNFLSTEADVRRMRAAVRIGREVAGQQAYADLRRGEIQPGANVVRDVEIDDFLQRQVATDFHPVGTCRMGSDEMAVVDSQLRVVGVDGLRVIDASIMPRITNANTNATTIMIAEKGADMVLGRPSLPRADIPRPQRQ